MHQGAIEAIFLDSMREFGLDVSRPAIPVSLQLSEDALELKDPEAYPVRVRSLSPRLYVYFLHHSCCELQVVLRHLGDNVLDETEVVHAKFVIGADGKQRNNAKKL